MLDLSLEHLGLDTGVQALILDAVAKEAGQGRFQAIFPGHTSSVINSASKA